MTTLADRPRTRGGAAFVAGQPQVNLLPPEVRAARGLKTVKRLLVMALVLVVLLCAATWVFARNDKSTAAAGLTTAQDQTTQLKAQEKKYAEVPQVLGLLDSTTKARAIGTSTEVLWSPYYQAIAAVLPQNVSIDTLTVTGGTPMAAPPAAASPLQAPSVGQIQFTGRSKTLPDTAAWIDALDAIPGLGDAWVATAVIQGDTATDVYYNITATVQVQSSAYAHRFDQTTTGGKS
jgi:Tfp pilus assembly protein PilN